MNIIEFWWDCLKARLRGERRIAPRGVKGRVYQKVDVKLSDVPGLIASGKIKASLRATGFYSAAEDQWYDLDKDGNRTPRRGPWLNKIARKK